MHRRSEVEGSEKERARLNRGSGMRRTMREGRAGFMYSVCHMYACMILMCVWGIRTGAITERSKIDEWRGRTNNHRRYRGDALVRFLLSHSLSLSLPPLCLATRNAPLMRTDDGQLCKRAYCQHRVRRVTSRAPARDVIRRERARSAPLRSAGLQRRPGTRPRSAERATSSRTERKEKEKEKERARERERERKEESAARARGSGSERGLADAAQLTHRTRAH